MKPLPTNKPYVSICFSPSFSHIEFVVYDPRQQSISATDNEPFYINDFNTRDLDEEYSRLKVIIRRLYERNKIAINTPTVVTYPSFFTRDTMVPDGMQDHELGVYILSQVEGFYLFKKTEPVVGYTRLPYPNRVLYSAYPKASYLPLEQIFSDLKIPILSFECHHTATLRGLAAIGAFTEEQENDLKWAMVLLDKHATTIYLAEGHYIEKMLESPVGTKGNEPEQILEQLSTDFQELCQYEVLNKIIVVNNTAEFNEAAIRQTFDVAQIDVYHQNDRTVASLGAENADRPCTIEAIGGVFSSTIPQVPVLSILQTNLYEQVELARQKDKVGIILIALAGLLFALYMGNNVVTDALVANKAAEIAQIDTEMQNIKPPAEMLNELKSRLFVKRSVNQNIGVNNLMIKSFQVIPPDAWLDSIIIEAPLTFDRFNVEIKGAGLTPNPLDTYIQELNTQLKPEQKLTPQVEPKQTPNNQPYFSFTLNNAPVSTGQ